MEIIRRDAAHVKHRRAVVERTVRIQKDVELLVADTPQEDIRRVRIKLDARAKYRQGVLAVVYVHDILKLIKHNARLSPYRLRNKCVKDAPQRIWLPGLPRVDADRWRTVTRINGKSGAKAHQRLRQ